MLKHNRKISVARDTQITESPLRLAT